MLALAAWANDLPNSGRRQPPPEGRVGEPGCCAHLSAQSVPAPAMPWSAIAWSAHRDRTGAVDEVVRRAEPTVSGASSSRRTACRSVLDEEFRRRPGPSGYANRPRASRPHPAASRAVGGIVPRPVFATGIAITRTLGLTQPPWGVVTFFVLQVDGRIAPFSWSATYSIFKAL